MIGGWVSFGNLLWTDVCSVPSYKEAKIAYENESVCVWIFNIVISAFALVWFYQKWNGWVLEKFSSIIKSIIAYIILLL